MKKKLYRICVESYFSNNSDFKEYDIYYTEATTWEEANEHANKCIIRLNKTNSGIIYNIFNIEEA